MGSSMGPSRDSAMASQGARDTKITSALEDWKLELMNPFVHSPLMAVYSVTRMLT